MLPEPTDVELSLNHRDLKFETYRGSGPGGQHRNTSDTAVRVTHIPTGIQACSEIKSQAQNKKLAVAALRARLIERKEDNVRDRRNGKRRSQVGTGMRSDKIRTYAEQRGRVENHLNGKRCKISVYDKGFVELLH